MAFAMVEFIHYCSVKLDRRFSWRSQFSKRAIRQIGLGILVPLTIDVIAYAIHFNSIGQDIRTNGFLRFDIYLITAFLVIINLYYLAYNLWYSKPEQTNSDEEIFKVSNSGITVNLDLRKDIILFAYINRQLRVYDREGKIYPVKDKLANLIKQLEDKGYCQINRSTIVNLEAVKGYKIGAKRNTLELFIVTDLDEIDEDKRPNLTVTGENIDDFKSKFDIR
ncbi:LytTR family DNA-binding domain-containing protein [Flavobacterium sp. UBA4197]|uniref:LytTR family DNA-binding domain-containing protein n=1 Tax=Flavobacterium sp. UBA4197 TaxID=1946546 RepID=UPI00257DCFAF|nr:LytTR family DNA-binding domain-containing protein [Flavobacterium sp. UBA4197]